MNDMTGDLYRFDGRRALIVGGASGIGEAAVSILSELGADVTVMDLRMSSVARVSTIGLDLRELQSIEDAISQVAGPIDVILCCAGVADQGFAQRAVFQINFIGQRHVIECALDRDLLVRGSAIGMISSLAGHGWERNVTPLGELLSTADFDAASELADRLVLPEGMGPYAYSKQAVNAYCAWRAVDLGQRGIRINTIAPAPTRTPLLDATPKWVASQTDFEETMGHAASSASEQAYPLVFMCSAAASFVSGTVLNVDAGLMGGSITGALDRGFGRRLAARLEPAS